jgi:hypothetical protein
MPGTILIGGSMRPEGIFLSTALLFSGRVMTLRVGRIKEFRQLEDGQENEPR